jgi:pimeloyl-ACP methyl ester carboxylesterase
VRRLLGLKNLIHDLIEKTTDLVEETHESVAATPVRMLSAIEPLADATLAVDGARRLTTSAVYTTIRATNHGIRLLGDVGVALARSAAAEAGVEAPPVDVESRSLATPLRSSALGSLAWWVDHAQGALNGAIGDFLSERGNGLEIRMGLRHHGVPIEPEREALAGALPAPATRLCIFVHGLGCTEWAWSFLAEEFHGDAGTNFGTLLGSELGYSSLYVRYNTGLHVSENGRKLADLVESVVTSYPGDLHEIVLVGHSMGGLVARSAAHYGAEGGAAWVGRLSHVFCIGSPHMGAPLEQASNALASVLAMFDTAGTQVPAKILNARSAGIKDLRFGYVVDEDWAGKHPDAFLQDNRHDVPFVESALYCFIGSTLTRDPNHPVGQLLGDVLVRLPSAAGFAPDASRSIPFHMGRVVGGAHHLELMNHPEVYAVIRQWLSERAEVPRLPALPV